MELALVRDGHFYYLIVDWSLNGVGYTFFCGLSKYEVLICLNSHNMLDGSRSFLGALKSVAWVLQDVKPLVQVGPQHYGLTQRVFTRIL